MARKLRSSPSPPLDDTSFHSLLSTDVSNVDDSSPTLLNTPVLRKGPRRRFPLADRPCFVPTVVETSNSIRPQKSLFDNDEDDVDIGTRCTLSDNNKLVVSVNQCIGDVINVDCTRCELPKSRFNQEFVTDGFIVAGDFGELYKCTNLLDGVAYAVKKTKKIAAHRVRERFVCEEVRAHSMIGRHPNIVSYFSAWHEGGHVYIQTELCNGGTLEYMIHKSDRVFCDNALKRLLYHVCKGLAHIHSNRLAHLDIRSANILICRTGDALLLTEQLNDGDESIDRDIVYKIGNFGHSVYVEDNVQTIKREYWWNSRKELLCNDYSELQKADIFSTALIVYEAAAKSHSLKNKLKQDSEFSLPQITIDSATLNTILQKMVDSDPNKRPNASVVVKQLLYRATFQQDITDFWKFDYNKSFIEMQIPKINVEQKMHKNSNLYRTRKKPT